MLPLNDDQPSWRFPLATVFIIAVNAAVFYEQLRVGIDHSVDIGGLVPVKFLNSHWLPGVARMISSMFMHGSWMHLIGNMWFLLVFGKGVEAAAGPARFVLFYLLCGLAADCLYVFFSPQSHIPLIGASGAVSGVLGASLMLHPKASITILKLPVWCFLIIWFGMQILLQVASATRGHSGGDVAYLAHIGGFAAGLFLIFFFKKRADSLGSNVSG